MLLDTHIDSVKFPPLTFRLCRDCMSEMSAMLWEVE